ncbi:arginine--tRNA ligase [Candidatus Saccharibacteria bacterium]|nr:arginine--tRNA ligase [Candidatus Saccharibacteria bacterium]
MENINKSLIAAIHGLYNYDYVPELTPSPTGIDADYSTNAPLKLAKVLHKSPMQIGEEIAAKLGVSVFVTKPGFLNFTLTDDYLKTAIDALDADFTKEISSDSFKGQTVICEFSDPNPFKVLHVGHLYTSIVGDSISRLFAYAGARVIRANFGGDVGLHVAKTLYVLDQNHADPATLTIDDIARSYVAGTRLYDDDGEAHHTIDLLNQQIYDINAKDLHDTDLARLYWRGRELSYDYFKDFYASIGLKFDKYYPESTVAALGYEKVKSELASGVYEKSDGAVIFPGERYGLHTRVFINSHGVPTYETKDVGLIFTKWQDYHFDKSIVITGNEQTEYMKVVMKSVEQYAPELVERTTHLTHGMVRLPGNQKMSSRHGNFLRAVDVLEMVRTELANEYNSTDEKISLAATKYAFLKYKMGADIIFDPHASVQMTGNSGPYLLYSAVRAAKILAKPHSSETPESSKASSPLHPAERTLMKSLTEYKATLTSALVDFAPYKVANYLYDLAQVFSRFYEACPVNGSAEETFRRELVSVYLSVMTHGLHILGTEIPSEM